MSQSTSSPQDSRSSSPSTGDKRPAEPLEDVTNGKKPRKSSAWKARGRRWALTVNWFDPVKVVFDNGALLAAEEAAVLRQCIDESDQEYQDWWENLEEYQRRQLRTYKMLRKLLAAHEPRALTDLSIWQLIEPELQRGVSSEKSDGTNKIKTTCVEWLIQDLDDLSKPLNPPIRAKSKLGRGFNHKATGRLLWPVKLPWNETTRLELLNRTAGDDAPKGDDWPRMLYRNEKMNPSNIWDGFLQHEHLIQAAKCILTSPSSASTDKDILTTRKGKAKIHGIEEITIGFIAYIASTLRYALTAYDSYSLSDEGLDVDGFYSSLYDLLIDPDEQEDVEKLLTWWNRRIFGKTPGGHRSSATSTRALFRQQRLAQKAAAAAV